MISSKRYLLCFMITNVIVTMCDATVFKIKTDKKFYQKIALAPIALVYFYNLDEESKKAKTNDRYKQANSNYHALNAISEKERYRIPNISFMAVNLDRDNLASLKEKYNLKDNDSFVLFKKSKPVTQKYLTGSITKRDLVDYIEQHFADYIEDSLDDYDEQMADTEEQEMYYVEKPRRTTTYYYEQPRRVRRYYYSEPYYAPYNYPGWYGWGGGWGWNYPYYGNYYGGPGFGIGFSIGI